MRKAVKTIMSISVSRKENMTWEEKENLKRIKLIFKGIKGPIDHLPGTFNTNQLWYETPAFIYPIGDHFDIFGVGLSDSAFINYLYDEHKIDIKIKIIYNEDRENKELVDIDYFIPDNKEITYMPYPGNRIISFESYLQDYYKEN